MDFLDPWAKPGDGSHGRVATLLYDVFVDPLLTLVRFVHLGLLFLPVLLLSPVLLLELLPLRRRKHRLPPPAESPFRFGGLRVFDSAANIVMRIGPNIG